MCMALIIEGKAYDASFWGTCASLTEGSLEICGLKTMKLGDVALL